jgi:hypothetical protein
MDEPIFIDLASLAGVDAETFAAADRGDRQAQKVIMRNLMTSKASASALTTQHWTHWMLRMIATGSEQAACDSLGSIAEAGRNGVISEGQATALNEMYEQHFGPGEVGEPASGNALAAFDGEDRERGVVTLFLLADRLASGSPDVTPADVVAAARVAEGLGSKGAQAFFGAVGAQILARSDPVSAFEVALHAADLYQELAGDDPIYVIKLGQTALLAIQIAHIAGEPQAASMMSLVHADAIAAYQASAQAQ